MQRTEERSGCTVVIDEYSRECLAIRVDRRIRSVDVIETLTELMVTRGVPEHIRSDNGPEFTAQAIRNWLGKVGAANPIHTLLKFQHSLSGAPPRHSDEAISRRIPNEPGGA